MNILPRTISTTTSRILTQLYRLLGQPQRLRILMAIGYGEACVCHLEAVLGQRQAYISQQLMALRRGKLVRSRREGRNIFYQLTRPELLEIIKDSAIAMGISPDQIHIAEKGTLINNCPCPHCLTE